MRAYIDSSVLVSLYSADPNFKAAVELIEAAEGELLVTTFGELEVVNAFALRAFRKELSTAEAESSLRDFEKDVLAGVFQLRPLSEQTYERARQLSQRTTPKLGTRTGDLLHVAAALELDAEYLYSFDRQQRKLAQTVGLRVN